MLRRELFLVVDGSGAVVGEFLVELNFDQPGILATLSNVFAEHDINIVNIAIDAARRNLHFIVDLTHVGEDELAEVEKQLKMFAFVKRVAHRVSKARIFVPRWIQHEIEGTPAVGVEKTLIGSAPQSIAVEMARRDSAFFRNLVKVPDAASLEEFLYIVQLRGLGVVEESSISGGQLKARVCSLTYPLARKYIEALLSQLEVKYRAAEEGNCIAVEVSL